MEQLDSTKLSHELAALGEEIKGFFKRSESFHNAMAYLEALIFSPLSAELLDLGGNGWLFGPTAPPAFLAQRPMGSQGSAPVA